MFLVQKIVTKKHKKLGIPASPYLGLNPKFYHFLSASLTEERGDACDASKDQTETTKMQDADCSNVDEAGFPKDRLGHNAVARRNSFSICTTGEGNPCHHRRGQHLHHRRGQHLPPHEVAVQVQP